MTNKSKAMEVAKNLYQTISKMSGNATVGESSLKNNNIFSGTRPAKTTLEQQLKKICKRYNIDIETLK